MPSLHSSPGIQGWHPGESTLHKKLNFSSAVETKWRSIEPQLREQHRVFHTSNLPFIPMTAVDEFGRPWVGIAAGNSGEVGFVKGDKGDLRRLEIRGRGWRGDPWYEMLRGLPGDLKGNEEGSEGIWNEERVLTAGLGIEFSTRRRNKFAGRVRGVEIIEDDAEFVVGLEVNEAVGNCPKYINTRTLDPYPSTNPRLIHHVQHMQPGDRLPEEVTNMTTAADTIFIATLYKSTPATSSKFPSHAGMNARSGLPGFIRVNPRDGHTIILPDYSGNRFMSSLGNIEASGVAGFTIVDFESGDVLYLTGTAKILIGAPAMEIMKRHACVVVFKTTGYTLVKDALPVRQRVGSVVGRSPYSPKVKYLVEEADSQGSAEGTHKACLDSAIQLSDDLAVFKFKILSGPDASSPLRIRPGQAIVLDFMDWLGPPVYQHMADSAPGSLNDDRVRTWTVSSAHEDQDATWFELTMREMKGGAVTGALFDILRWVSPTLDERIEIGEPVVTDIVGVTGDFFLAGNEINALWVAGGVGMTPFLAMLEALGHRENARGDIVFALSTKEPDIMLGLVGNLLRNVPMSVKIKLDLFTHSPITIDFQSFESENIHISIRNGRVGPEYWKTISQGRDVLICGPDGFGNAAVEGLRAAGVPNGKIQREGFY
ncbi:uncharacterized protein BDV14DRAFT_199763 [Aspergillus stella-maris]|uniref:uncharacterized protein n=1 Tax=Aspergillus stella-maris TaxID=1810926 RepID=UPI003CCD2FE2